MKIFLLLLTLIFNCCLLQIHSAFAEGEGKYQLFQGKYTHADWDQGTTTQNEEIFLLDTATGDVQVYVSGVTKGKKMKYWAPAIVDETKS